MQASGGRGACTQRWCGASAITNASSVAPALGSRRVKIIARGTAHCIAADNSVKLRNGSTSCAQLHRRRPKACIATICPHIAHGPVCPQHSPADPAALRGQRCKANPNPTTHKWSDQFGGDESVLCAGGHRGNTGVATQVLFCPLCVGVHLIFWSTFSVCGVATCSVDECGN